MDGELAPRSNVTGPEGMGEEGNFSGTAPPIRNQDLYPDCNEYEELLRAASVARNDRIRSIYSALIVGKHQGKSLIKVCALGEEYCAVCITNQPLSLIKVASWVGKLGLPLFSRLGVYTWHRDGGAKRKF